MINKNLWMVSFGITGAIVAAIGLSQADNAPSTGIYIFALWLNTLGVVLNISTYTSEVKDEQSN